MTGRPDNDPILDRSPKQKRIRIQKLRVELAAMGYSVVSTKWLEETLNAIIVGADREEEDGKA